MEESRAAIFMLVSYEYQLLKAIHMPLICRNVYGIISFKFLIHEYKVYLKNFPIYFGLQ